jgi:hypothetical protein
VAEVGVRDVTPSTTMATHLPSKPALALAAAMLLSACATATTVTPPTAPSPPSYRATVLADRPVAYWPMDEKSGKVMADLSPTHDNGTYTGSPALGQAGPAGIPASAAAAFDGSSSWASAPDVPALRVNTITIELWLKKRSNTYYGVFVGKNVLAGHGAGSSWFSLLNHGTDGRLEFRVASDDSTLTSSASLALNTWYYVVATYDGTTARLYINGALDSSVAFAGVPNQTNDPVYLGRRSDGWGTDASLCQVAIYPAALPAARIAAHWQAATP